MTVHDIGVHLEVEMKKPGKVPTDKQAAYLVAIASHGGIGVWADSVAMLETKIRAVFRSRGWAWPV